MNATTEPGEFGNRATPTATNSRRWKRIFRRATIAICIVALVVAYLLKDHIRTLRSLRHIPGTNAYVMDYYVDYHMDEIRTHGMDVNNVEDSLIDVFFPDWIASIATGLKGRFLDEKIEPYPIRFDRCSSVSLHSPGGHVFFGRNLDWMHDACLIVRVHHGGLAASVSVIDLHYLNLDRDDLETTNLFQRLPLLFAPYYVQDGMNQHGVAVSDMSVEGVQPPYDASKPDILHSTAMRLILDYAKSLDEAVAIIEQYNIHFVATTCHLMIADATGKSAVVEFIDGKVQVTPGKENWQVCTNDQICGKTEEDCDQSCDRYYRASDQLAKLNSAAGADDVMRIMESVSKDNWTMWSSVYDLSAHEFRVAYRRHFDCPVAGSLGASD